MKIVQGFIRELGSILETFFTWSRRQIFSPHVLVFFSFFATVYASFTSNFYSLYVIIATSIFFAILAEGQRVNLLKCFLVIALFNVTVAFPKILLTGLNMDIDLFLLRTIASGFVFSSAVAYMGFQNFLSGLRRLGFPERYLRTLYLFAHNVVVLGRETLKILVARAARNIVPNRRFTWQVLASTVGSVLVKSGYRARMQYLALKARNGLKIEPSSGFKPCDMFLIGVILWLIFLSI